MPFHSHVRSVARTRSDPVCMVPDSFVTMRGKSDENNAAEVVACLQSNGSALLPFKGCGTRSTCIEEG